jgi:hypothetical protein
MALRNDEGMNDTDITEYLMRVFEGVDMVTAAGNGFFFYNPGPAPDHRMPFTTLMTNDDNDQFSNLNRPGIFRLNVGVSRNTYRSLFGSPPALYIAPPGHEYTALDILLPHPVYARMSWVCVLSPSPATFERVKPLLAEAYGLARRRAAGREH